jgi:hypothetical protein
MADESNAYLKPLHLDDALNMLMYTAVSNISGVDLASISIRDANQRLTTAVATDDLAHRLDEIQYEFREGPCYDAVTDKHLVLVNDLRHSSYREYGPRAAEFGLGSQLATQVAHNGSQAGLNLYARRVNAFDDSSTQLAQLFGLHVGVVLGYALAVENLERALETRGDISAAVGVIMGRFDISRDRAFDVLVRLSNHRNVQLRVIARGILDGTFDPTAAQGDALREDA